jgi:hypothetical protein
MFQVPPLIVSMMYKMIKPKGAVQRTDVIMNGPASSAFQVMMKDDGEAPDGPAS